MVEQDATPTLPPAPATMNMAVIMVAGAVAIVTIVGVVVLAIVRPGDGQQISLIIAAGFSAVSALLALAANRGVQVIHQMVNSRMDTLLAETRRRAEIETTLIERAAAAAAAEALEKKRADEQANLAE